MNNIINLIHEKCENATGNIYDIYYALYKDYLLGHDNPAFILQKLSEEVQHHEFKDDQNYNYICEEEIEKTGYLYFDLLKSYVHSLVLKNLNEQDFYQKLYSVVFQSDIFPQDEKTQAILLCFLTEKLREIPYFQAVNLLKMDSNEYKEAIQRLNPKIQKIINVLNRNFKSRTEEASQIYEILSSLKNRNDKIVLLSVYTNIIQTNISDCQGNCQ